MTPHDCTLLSASASTAAPSASTRTASPSAIANTTCVRSNQAGNQLITDRLPRHGMAVVTIVLAHKSLTLLLKCSSILNGNKGRCSFVPLISGRHDWLMVLFLLSHIKKFSSGGNGSKARI